MTRNGQRAFQAECALSVWQKKDKVYNIFFQSFPLTLSSNEEEFLLVGLALGLSQENSKKPGRLTCYRYEELSLARRQKNLMWARRQPWSRNWELGRRETLCQPWCMGKNKRKEWGKTGFRMFFCVLWACSPFWCFYETLPEIQLILHFLGLGWCCFNTALY